MVDLDPSMLGQVTKQMLEEAAFLFADPAEEVPSWSPPVLQARLSFSGPRSGEIRLWASTSFGAEAAANLLGLEPGDEEAQQEAPAALAELLNIIVGSLMMQWFGTKVICRLGIPVVDPVQASATPPPGPYSACLVVDERHRIDVEAVFS